MQQGPIPGGHHSGEIEGLGELHELLAPGAWKISRAGSRDYISSTGLVQPPMGRMIGEQVASLELIVCTCLKKRGLEE